MSEESPEFGKYVIDGYQLDEAAREIVSQYNHQTGVPIKVLVRRLLQWFIAQPEPVKGVVLGRIDGGVRSAYADVLEEMARCLRADTERLPFDEAAEVLMAAAKISIAERARKTKKKDGGMVIYPTLTGRRAAKPKKKP